MLKIYLPRSGYPKIIAYATLWHTNNFLLLAGTCNFFRKKPFHFLKRSFQKVKWFLVKILQVILPDLLAKKL